MKHMWKKVCLSYNGCQGTVWGLENRHRHIDPGTVRIQVCDTGDGRFVIFRWLSGIGSCAWGKPHRTLWRTHMGPRWLDGQSPSAREAQPLTSKGRTEGKKILFLFWYWAPKGKASAKDLQTPAQMRAQLHPSDVWVRGKEMAKAFSWRGEMPISREMEILTVLDTTLHSWNLPQNWAVHPPVISGMGHENLNKTHLEEKTEEELSASVFLCPEFRTVNMLITWMMEGIPFWGWGLVNMQSPLPKKGDMVKWKWRNRFIVHSSMKRIHFKSFGLLSLCLSLLARSFCLKNYTRR